MTPRSCSGQVSTTYGLKTCSKDPSCRESEEVEADRFLCARLGTNPNSSGYGMLHVFYFILLPAGTIALISAISRARSREDSEPAVLTAPIAYVPGDDGRLGVHVRVALRQHPATDKLLPSIGVKVEQGIVTISGQVPDQEQRALVEHVVRLAVAGGEVNNQLTVAADPATESLASPTDGSRPPASTGDAYSP